jgi:hypothetical protein
MPGIAATTDVRQGVITVRVVPRRLGVTVPVAVLRRRRQCEAGGDEIGELAASRTARTRRIAAACSRRVAASSGLRELLAEGEATLTNPSSGWRIELRAIGRGGS